GGVMIPMSFTVINTQLPPSRRPVGLVLFGITATMAPAIGPYIGGLLTDNYGWPMVFYINFIPGAVMLATIFFAIDPEPLNMPLLWKGDWLGTVFMAIGLGSLIAFLEERAKSGLVYERFHSTLFYARGDFHSPFHYLRARQQTPGC